MEKSGVKQQQGAALVIVMVLLASALVMALVSMQTALIDERLAGNFRASIQAQMRSETAASEALARWEELDWQGAPLLDAPETARFEEYGTHAKVSTSHHCPQHSCFYMPVIYHSERWVMAMGATFEGSGTVVAQSAPLLIRRENPHEVGAEAAVVWQ